MMTTDILNHARWIYLHPRTWHLRARKKDGGARLAAIEGKPGFYTGYAWTAGNVSGGAPSFDQAVRAARATLRAALDAGK